MNISGGYCEFKDSRNVSERDVICSRFDFLFDAAMKDGAAIWKGSTLFRSNQKKTRTFYSNGNQIFIFVLSNDNSKIK